MPQPKKSSSSSGKSGGSSRPSSSSRSRSSSSSSRSSASRSAAAKKGAARSAAKRSSTSARRSGGAAASQNKAAAGQTKAAARADANALEQGLAALRTALTARAADSLNLVVLTGERMQQAFDEAVQRGHMTQQTANNLVADLVKRTQQEASSVFADVEQLVGKSRSGLEVAAKRVKAAPASDRALREADRARRVVGVGPSFPIIGYDDLTAAQINERLDDLSPAELRKVRDYERRHGNRKSVLQAVERKLAA